MKTGEQILKEYNSQSSDLATFKTLEQMIDEHTHSVVESAAKVCETAPGGNRETVARAIREMWDLSSRKRDRGRQRT